MITAHKADIQTRSEKNWLSRFPISHHSQTSAQIKNNSGFPTATCTWSCTHTHTPQPTGIAPLNFPNRNHLVHPFRTWFPRTHVAPNSTFNAADQLHSFAPSPPAEPRSEACWHSATQMWSACSRVPPLLRLMKEEKNDVWSFHFHFCSCFGRTKAISGVIILLQCLPGLSRPPRDGGELPPVCGLWVRTQAVLNFLRV